MINYIIRDNWLSEDECNKFYDMFTHGGFPWNLITNVNDQADSNDFQFAHKYVDDKKELYKNSTDSIKVLMRKLYDEGFVKKDVEIYRAKANLFLKESLNRGLGLHHDITNIGDNYSTLIYYVNTYTGGTRLLGGGFDNEIFIGSVRNRALIVEGKVFHETITQTDTNFRFNININYSR